MKSHCSLAAVLCLLFATLTMALTPIPERPRLQIINGSNADAEVFWLAPDGKKVASGVVQPGKDHVITTTLGHEFLVVGGKGLPEVKVKCMLTVQAYRYPAQEGGADGKSTREGAVTPPPSNMAIPNFYTQFISAHGFPIVASGHVNPYALKEAAHLANQMLDHRPDVRQAMIKSGARLCILAHDEFTTELPEFGHLTKPPGFEGISDKDYWDARARGTGGSKTDPCCTCAEENLLGFPGDPYATECIFIHEFAHNIHLRGMCNVDATFDGRLKRTYEEAMARGLWKGKYASVNHHEYFAEGVQSWFDDNRENDHDHNHVNTRVELLEYDPGLAALCREVFGDTVLKYTKPAMRLTGHMTGYEPEKAPAFAWPERLTKTKEMIHEKAVQRGKQAAVGQATQQIEGWTVHIHPRLWKEEPQATEKALTLLQKQLAEIVRNVPAPAVAKLRKVPLWFSPEYTGIPPRAEYHPSADWLRDHGRDPAIAKGVEFTNVRIFEEEMDRMPNFALHELAHGFHDRVLGFNHAGIEALYEKVKTAGIYDKVERWSGTGKRKTFGRAYGMSNAKEYFAELTESYFSRNDFYPFTREELVKHDPEMAALLREVWGVAP